MKIAQIILAAGGATRMGKPKQLLPVGDRTMVRRAVDAARATGNRVVVVTGAYGMEVYEELRDVAGVIFGHNVRWDEGMGRSIAIGVATANIASTTAYFITLADQPGLETHHLQRYLEAHLKAPDRIVATAYPEGPGVPAIFPRRLLNQLLKLEGKGGARQLLREDPEPLSLIAFEAPPFDIDTPEEYAAYLRSLEA